MNLVTSGQVVSEKKSFECVDGRRMTDGRRRLPILSALPEPSAQGSLKDQRQFLCVKIEKNKH